jgi:hypothetical protein
VASVAPEDDFFALGGDSLLAAQVAERVGEELGIDLRGDAVARHPVFADLERAVEAARGPRSREVVRVDRDGPLEASIYQEERLAVYRTEPRKVDYPIALALEIDGPCDPDAVRAALDALRARHIVLRTAFPLVPTLGSVRILDPGLGWPLDVHDLRALEPAARESWVADLVAATVYAPFDPLVGDLVRGDLIRVAAERWLLVLAFEHLVIDGRSVPVLLDELARLVSSSTSPPALPYEHLDFAAAQRRWLEAQRPLLVESWRPVWEALGPYPPLPLPPRTGADGAAIGPSSVVRRRRPAEAANRLLALAAERRTTPFVVGLAALLGALRRDSDGDAVGAVTPYAGRHWPGADALVGPFFNLLLIGADLSAKLALREAIPVVHDVFAGAIASAEIPYWELVRTFYPEQADRNPQRPYAFFAAGPAAEPEYAFGEARARLVEPPGHRREKRFPGITFELAWSDAGLEARCEYVAGVYERAPVEALVDEVLETLEAA